MIKFSSRWTWLAALPVSLAASAQPHHLVEVQAGMTLDSRSGGVTAADDGIVQAAGTIVAHTLRAHSGGRIAPGASPGKLTLQGNLDLLTGSVLEIEIGGTNAGVNYDQLVVRNATTASINGRLLPILFDGFTPQPADTFAILTSDVALVGTIENLAAGRVFTQDSLGSFALTFIDNGKIIQLGDYQFGTAIQRWRNLHFTSAQLDDPSVSGHEADPDNDGVTNLLEFAFNSPPLSASPSRLPQLTWQDGSPEFVFTRLAGGVTTDEGYEVPGLRYVLQHSTTLDDWENLAGTSPEVVSWTVTPDDDGVTETVRVRLALTAVDHRHLRLHVSTL
ncbi:MAG: hypothetical protein ACKV19_11425 [Verrucomicrobiales bacterium]